MKWVYNFPLWLFVPAAVIIMCGLSALGLMLVRRFGADDIEASRNDIAGAIVSAAGTVLAVMLSFMVVVVWQEYDASAASVLREAGALSDLHQIADAFPARVRERVQSDVDQYVEVVLNVEWPGMRTGRVSARAADLARSIRDDVLDYEPTAPAQVTFQQRSLDLIQAFLDARRQRLFDNDQGIAPFMWATMLLLSGATIFLTFLFQAENFRAHLLMTIALTAIITMILILIAELDYPFRGSLQVHSTAFREAMFTVHRPTGSPAGNP